MKKAALFLSLFLAGCCTCKDMPVQTIVNEIHHTQTVTERDTVFEQYNTIIREVDSVSLAAYGIQMQAAQKAWLVESRALQRQIREFQQQEAVHDTTTVFVDKPYPVEVERRLTWWQATAMRVGWLAMGLAVLTVAWWVIKRRI